MTSRREFLGFSLVVALAPQIAFTAALPDPQIRAYNGELHDPKKLSELIQQYHPKLVLVGFGYNGCPPCLDEKLTLNRLYDTYKSRGLLVLEIEVLGLEIARERGEDIDTILGTNMETFRNKHFPLVGSSRQFVDDSKYHAKYPVAAWFESTPAYKMMGFDGYPQNVLLRPSLEEIKRSRNPASLERDLKRLLL